MPTVFFSRPGGCRCTMGNECTGRLFWNAFELRTWVVRANVLRIGRCGGGAETAPARYEQITADRYGRQPRPMELARPPMASARLCGRFPTLACGNRRP